MTWIISVVDTISATSMPINEFVLFREKHCANVKQTLIVCKGYCPKDVIIPNSVDVIYTYKSRQLRKAIKEIIVKANKNKDQTVFHLHSLKSASLFYRSTLFLGIRKKTLFTVHSSYANRNLRYKISSIICSLLAKKVNCVSNAALDDYSKIVKKIKKQNIISIPNGVDCERIRLCLEKESRDIDWFNMVSVGRLIPIKNHKFLIDVIAEIPDAKLTLIGEDDKGKTIKNYAEEKGVYERIKFLGLLSRDDVFKELNRHGIYLSSSTVEGLPVSVLEATAVGLIPILSNIKPHKEIGKQINEAVVLPLDKDIWVKRIKDILDNIQQIKQELQFISSETTERFSLETMHKKYDTLYESLIVGTK